MPIIVIISEPDRDTILGLLQHTADLYRQELGEDYTGIWNRLAELFEKAPGEHVIRIILEGDVRDVENLPMGFSYEVKDLDACPDCGKIEPLCDWCRNE